MSDVADGGRNPPDVAARFTAEVRAFIASDQTEKSFPPTLDSLDRKTIHDICYELDLRCRSRGPKKDGRFITIYKPTEHELAAIHAQKARAAARGSDGSGSSSSAPTAPAGEEPQSKRARTATAGTTIPTRQLGSVGVSLPVLGFGGVILCADEFGDAKRCREFVSQAVERGATYVDVAPEYGDGVSQARLGPALEGLRERCFLACKTMFRDATGAQKDLDTSLAALRTDYLDLYQMHSITTKEDVDQALGPGGCLETFKKAKAAGVVKHLGFSAHNEEQALRLIATGEFETVLFPFNFAAFKYGGVGAAVLAAAREKGMGILALKAYAKCRLRPEEGDTALDLGGTLGPVVGDAKTIKHIPPPILASYKKDHAVVAHPKYKCWYVPEDDPVWAERLHCWALSLAGVTSCVAPGNAELFEMGMKWVQGWDGKVPPFDEARLPEMEARYKELPPIFHTKSEKGSMVSHA